MTGRGVVGQHVFAVKTEHADVVLAIQYHQLVRAKLDGLNGGPSWWGEGYADSLLAIDCDNARTELGLVGTDGQKRLYRIIGECRDL